MAEIILKQITSDVNFKKEIAPRYQELLTHNTNTQAKMASQFFVKKELFQKAFEIAGDTIDELSLENGGLKVELSKYGEIDEAAVRRFVETKQKNGDQAKNERILNELRKTMAKSRAITY